MGNIMKRTWFAPGVLIFLLLLVHSGAAQASFVIASQESVHAELKGYNGLSEMTLFQGTLGKGKLHSIETPCQGLGLLVLDQGQTYPVLFSEKLFTLNVTSPANRPTFTDSPENEIFYRALMDKTSIPEQYPFVSLMIEARKLLESSHSIRTVQELSGKNDEFQKFVSTNYQLLKHSDMVRRLIAQSFMMHEYVDYHVAGSPATNIRVKYRKTVMGSVKSWLKILKPHIPEHEVLNFCVSLYANRSMITLAHRIIENFKEVAFCPGNGRAGFRFSDQFLLTDGKRKITLGNVKGNKLIAFVSTDCPVSMVETVIKVRQSAPGKDDVVVVAPLEKLSEKHLAIKKMVSKGNVKGVEIKV